MGLFVAALRGRGLGREVTRLVLSWGFDVLGLHRIQLEVLAGNSRAINCYLACGSARKESAVEPSYTRTAGKTSSSWECPQRRKIGNCTGCSNAPGRGFFR